MAAIFDLLETPMLETVCTSPTELLDRENVGVAFEFIAVKYRSWDIALFHILPLMAIIFDLQLASMSESVHPSPTELLDVWTPIMWV